MHVGKKSGDTARITIQEFRFSLVHFDTTNKFLTKTNIDIV